MEIGEKILIALVVVVTFGAIGGAAKTKLISAIHRKTSVKKEKLIN